MTALLAENSTRLAVFAVSYEEAVVQVGDHTTRAIWLGKQLDVKTNLLAKMDTDTAAKGRLEEEVIWAVHHHGIDAS